MKPTTETDSASETQPVPKRRRRWWLLIPLLALAAAILALLPRQPDGLDFIRKYHPSGEMLRTTSFAVGTSSGTITETTWHRQFKFSTIPPELIAEMTRKTRGIPPLTPHTLSVLNVDYFTWNPEVGIINVRLGKPPPWLLQKWYALSEAILGR